MTWRVVVDVPTKDDAVSVKSLIDMALDEATVLDNVVGLYMDSYEVCEVDFMAGQICQLPAGHVDEEGTPHA